MKWRKGPVDWLSLDGCWRIRGPVFAKPMYWLYQVGIGRYTPTGSYEDVVSFKTVREAKQYVEKLIS